MKAFRVYGWTGWRLACPSAPNGSKQTREIMAAKSMAEVIRKTGEKRHQLTYYGCWTHNPEELKVANAKPGVVFWRPLNDRGDWQTG